MARNKNEIRPNREEILSMINGEICRLCVSSDLKELERMEAFAIENIKKLKRIRYEEMNNE